MPEPPLVTVLMSVYNDAAYLPAAVNSILQQTFTDLELLVIDDGSTDPSPRILSEVRDRRLRIVRQETNQGLTRSLQRGVELAQGRYLARLDADDVAFPERLERQVAFLERHPEVVLLGAGCVQVDEAGRFVGVWCPPAGDLELRWLSLLTNPFVHSTVMLRRAALQKHALNYDGSFPTAQDYDLWARLMQVGQTANLEEPLIYYRLRAGITGQRRGHQLALAAEVARRRIREELPDFAIEREQIEALLAGILHPQPASTRRPECWAAERALYRQLLSAFGKRYGEHKDWGKVRQSFACAVVRSVGRHGLSRASLGAVKSALAVDPFVLVRLVQDRRRARAWQGRFAAGLGGARAPEVRA